MAVKPHRDPWLNAIQAPPTTDRTALAYSQLLMAAFHPLCPHIRLRTPAAMTWTAATRSCLSTVVWCLRHIRCGTRTSMAIVGSQGRVSGWGWTLLRLLAKQQGPQPLQAEPGLLQGEQQPKIDAQYLHQ